jgi:hypothetical protein
VLSPDELLSIAAEPYEHRGILHSEMALIIHTCRRLGVEIVIESGRARGQSTYMLAKYLPSAEIHSVELRDHPDDTIAQERLLPLRNVTFYSGDGNVLIPQLVALYPQPIAILCDGPKGKAAVNIIARCFEYPHVRVGFVHDMRRLDHGGPSPHRAAAVAQFPDVKFSDDPNVVSGSSWMDQRILEAGGPCGPKHEAEFGSYGPTVGVFLNNRSHSNQQ